jgi:hypothetical protein
MVFPDMSFDDWLEYGLRKRWCGPTICFPHDGFPSSLHEDDLYSTGDDPCMHMIRLYEDEKIADAVEQNHVPSQWRKPRKLHSKTFYSTPHETKL